MNLFEFKLLASTQYEIDMIKASIRNISEVKNPFDYKSDTQDINIAPSNKIEFTITSDLDTRKNNVSNRSSSVNEESDIEIDVIVTNYVLSICQLEETPEQKTKNTETTSILKEINEANGYESEKVIDKTEPTNLSDSEKVPEQENENPFIKPKILSLPILIKTVQPQKESAIRKLDTRSLHDDTYMTHNQKPGNKIKKKF